LRGREISETQKTALRLEKLLQGCFFQVNNVDTMDNLGGAYK